ncbi:class I SAM-dependent methyltransferase [Streptomyces sp. NPDC012637]|uniref:class I SAM-dependent methyltransferase n=1 Tax=Streptomyces sp. NPDC012637 TaxID=3364842 RepID=UPI0036EDE81D
MDTGQNASGNPSENAGKDPGKDPSQDAGKDPWESAGKDPWESGPAYERYMGRWSRLAAARFTEWLDPAEGLRWLDVGCGTGALSAAVADRCRPRVLLGLELSEPFVRAARATAGAPAAGGGTTGESTAGDLAAASFAAGESAAQETTAGESAAQETTAGESADPETTAGGSTAGGSTARGAFVVADATALPVRDAAWDAAVCGLTLNFLPDPAAGAAELVRAVRPGGGTVAAYVWDYADGMGFLRHFWDAVATVDPAAAVALDEGRRFGTLCRPERLHSLWTEAGLAGVTTVPIDVPTVFTDFADLWDPFLTGQGPAPGYVASLTPGDRDRVRTALAEAVPREPDGSVELTARAWAVKGVRR